MVASQPHVPARVRERLSVVLANIRSGRPDLTTKRRNDLVGPALTHFTDGEYAFGDASDLIGGACGVPLAAEPYDGRVVLCLAWTAQARGDARAGDDLVEVRWFDPDELPPQSELAFTHYPEVLSAALAGRHEHA